jgi:cyanobactin maturation PatA/PatG family protease
MNYQAQLELIWRDTMGDPAIKVAILDGGVDGSHPSFAGADLTFLPGMVTSDQEPGLMTVHGTHVASVIVGQHSGPVRGVAPRCSALILPIFSNDKRTVDQLNLARAIEQAMEAGAHIINISGGEFSHSGEPDTMLAKVLETCWRENRLIVAAAGNNGCSCLHIPAATRSVLAVGALDQQDHPLSSSNWGDIYQSNGVVAPGENILGAAPGNSTIRLTGTSFAAPIVSGLAALCLSAQLQSGRKPDPRAVREAILATATPCNPTHESSCARFLKGRLNITATYTFIRQGEFTNMAENTSEVAAVEKGAPGIQPSAISAPAAEPPIPQTLPSGGSQGPAETPFLVASPETTPGIQASCETTPNTVTPSCACKSRHKQPPVFAIGTIGYDFGTEARRDTFRQLMPPQAPATVPNPYDPRQMVSYLEANPWEAESLIWTLNLELTPMYAIEGEGPFADKVYELLRTSLSGQVQPGDSKDFIERVSAPGFLSARTVRLYSGQVVPVLVPEYRGMFQWNINNLIDGAVNAVISQPQFKAQAGTATVDSHKATLRGFLDRIYYDLRNLGQTSQDRALNYTATNAFQAAQVWLQQSKPYTLDGISVQKSPYCRVDSDCWDVKLSFFDPENDRVAREVYRFTIDVSDVTPVTMGEIRHWKEPR